MSKKATFIWMAGIFLASAYLSLVNLGNTSLWVDEATPAFIGENLWRNGTLSAWNGRTLYVGDNGLAANSDLMLVSYPPWQALPTALGIGIFGANEFGVRVFHTLLGLASLLIFWQLLRMDFAPRPRLRVLAFALFALSTQVILFMRVGRYVADAFFFTLLTFYAYRLYISPAGKVWHLALAAGATVLGFLNHFTITAAFALSLGVWHLLFHFKQTTARQWAQMGVAALGVGGLCFSYLVAIGVLFSDEVLEYHKTYYETPFLQRKVIMVAQNFRELLRYGILPLWVALWLAWFAYTRLFGKDKAAIRAGDGIASHILMWTALLLLFMLFSALLSVRSPVITLIPAMRYIAPALAFGALLTAAFIDHLWQLRRVGRVAAIAMLLLALNTNMLSYPLIFPDKNTGETLRLLLPNLLREVHTARHHDYTYEAVKYLSEHAQQGDTIVVHPSWKLPVMQFYLADKLVFCCALNENSPLPKQKVRQLGVPMYEGDVEPEWWVISGSINSPAYELAHAPEIFAYPTNRPELHFHAFAPLLQKHPYLRIYRRKP